jgi:tetratricopeptide (TPR) repeat protein
LQLIFFQKKGTWKIYISFKLKFSTISINLIISNFSLNMKYVFNLIIYCFIFSSSFGFQINENNLLLVKDTNEVYRLNSNAYQNRLTDPVQTISTAKKALKIANELNFKNGEAEAYRVLGIGYYYLNQRDSALNNYLLGLNLFIKNNNELGEAKVSNNIGNLWLDIDYDKSLFYFDKTLKIAKKFNKKDLIAGSYLNIGNAYFRKKNYSIALKNYQESSEIFNELNNPIGITQSLQNRGVIYYSINNFEKAIALLLEANQKAKQFELNASVGSINLTLTSSYIATGNYSLAEKYLEEGKAFAKIVNDEKRIYDYIYTNYELEYQRKNYAKAIVYLKEVHDQDSVFYKQNIASNINLIQETLKQQQVQSENERIIENQKNAKKLTIAATAVLILAFMVIFLLVRTNKKSKKSNAELQRLNDEVKQQKNNVDRINQKLEEIITERTKDLIIKNQKLGEYSSHLSHQIRAPVATLKGLMLLIEAEAVNFEEIVPQINKCVDNIDIQILDINDALHDPTRYHLNRKN